MVCELSFVIDYVESLEPSITLEAFNQDIELETCEVEIEHSKYLLTVSYFSLSWSFNISSVWLSVSFSLYSNDLVERHDLKII